MKHLKLILLLTVILAVWSCEQKQTEIEQTIDKTISSDGHEGHERCIWEGGLVEDRHRRATQIQLLYGGKFDVFINDNCSNLYTQAITNAIDEFNAIDNTSLHLTIVNSANNADMIIHCEHLGSNSIGGYVEANVPVDVKLNTGISNTSEFCLDNEPIGLCRLQFIAMHEIGHAIGLAHTDDTSAPLIPGTAVHDFFSIMNSSNQPNAFCVGLCEFTDEDINAIQILYPLCNAPKTTDITFTEHNTRIYLYAYPYQGDTHQFRYRFNGGSWQTLGVTTSHYDTILNKQCGTYQVQLRQKCGKVRSSWSGIKTITTCQ